MYELIEVYHTAEHLAVKLAQNQSDVVRLTALCGINIAEAFRNKQTMEDFRTIIPNQFTLPRRINRLG